MKDDQAYLAHISECLTKIERYVAGGRETFFADDMVQDAVIRNLQTLAESTRRLSETVKATRPEVEWRSIAAFRNVVVHDYMGLDSEQIWNIVDQDLPLSKTPLMLCCKNNHGKKR
ncbi:MAG: hypothetical protein JMDDDDMK_03296 [Acidobacteria bacterium]|nr:hypothetical protein [Acidobacteriota bacterium]